MLALLYRWHRRLALGLALVLLAWMLSGLLHPLISRMSVPPRQPAPALTVVDPASVVPAQQLLRQHGIEHWQHLSLFGVDDKAIYQVQETAGALPRHFSASDGRELPEFAVQWATQLAFAYAGVDAASAPSVTVTPVLAFSDDYPLINRYLPAWRVQWQQADRFTVYIDALSGRPAATEHRQQKIWRQIFQWLHTFSFAPPGPIRYGIQLTLIGASLVLGLAGIGLWWQQRRRPAVSRLRHWHRRMGIGLSVPFLMFTFSGSWHLIDKLLEPAPVVLSASPLATAQLSAEWPRQLAVAELVWLRAEPDGTTQWRAAAKPIASHEHDHAAARQMPPAAAGWLTAAGEARNAAAVFAPQLAQLACSPSPEQAPAILQRFAGDYGFLNKRLPVWQFPCEDGRSLFFDPADSALAAQVTPANRLEGWSFHYLHKWHFLDALGRDARDLIQALCVLALVALTAIGVSMYLIRQRQRRARS